MEQKNETDQQSIVSGEQNQTAGSAIGSMNLPKKISEYRQIKATYFGLSLAVLGFIFGFSSGSMVMALAVGGFGLLMALLSFISYRQLRKSEKTQPSFNQFQTSTATTYSAPKDLVSATSAGPANNETVEKWLGPIMRVDKGAISYTVLSKEVDKQAENTLLFTASQAIAIMLAPADMANASQGVLGSAASALINYSDESGGDKGQQFRLLHSKHWDKLMTPLLQMPLSKILQTHFSYSIPYSKVQSIEVKNSLMNPGFIFHLTDGSKLHYAVLQKNQIDEIKNYLQKKITLES